MKLAIAGLWHLGTVTAACCAQSGHQVIGIDDDQANVGQLQQGRLPVDEPGLSELTVSGLESGKLKFTTDPAAISGCELLWVCYDTPVDEEDHADTEFVTARISSLIKSMKAGSLVLISSQLPVGAIAQLETQHSDFLFACSPENLRLGKAIDVFTKPDRVIIGVRDQRPRPLIEALFAPITDKLEWMSIESAEMTKHAINAFLATSVSFINEIAGICEKTGADALEVERGLKTDQRIGPKAYLHAGSAFAGGTLARDIQFLLAAGSSHNSPVHLLSGVLQSNSAHQLWAQRQLSQLLGNLKDKTIAVLGLTYKPGTNTLRRSSSVDVCRWLIQQEARVQAFDPCIHLSPEALEGIHLAPTAELALKGSAAVLIATPWPEFQLLSPELFPPLVLDPARHLGDLLKDSGLAYYAIGVAR